MLLKLLKYDFRAMWKKLSLVWGAALVLALLTRYTSSFGFMVRAHDYHGNIPGFVAFALLAVLTAMFVIAVVFIINRFSKGLLGSEGYLMHTLPVRPWQLVLSKLACAIVVYAGSFAVTLLCLLLMIPTDWLELLDISLWTQVVQGVLKHPDIIPLMLEFCLVLLSTAIQSIATMYLAMAIGHLFARHRKLISVAAFIGLYTLLGNVYNRVFSWDPLELLLEAVDSNVHASMLAASATMLIPAAVFLAAVCWILEHKLNLE